MMNSERIGEPLLPTYLSNPRCGGIEGVSRRCQYDIVALHVKLAADSASERRFHTRSIAQRGMKAQQFQDISLPSHDLTAHRRLEVSARPVKVVENLENGGGDWI
jgi:hypothetical protein